MNQCHSGISETLELVEVDFNKGCVGVTHSGISVPLASLVLWGLLFKDRAWNLEIWHFHHHKTQQLMEIYIICPGYERALLFIFEFCYNDLGLQYFNYELHRQICSSLLIFDRFHTWISRSASGFELPRAYRAFSDMSPQVPCRYLHGMCIYRGEFDPQSCIEFLLQF